MDPLIPALVLFAQLLGGLVLAAVSMRRALSVEAETLPGTRTAECWAHMTDPGATCICKPWSDKSQRKR